SSTSRSGNGPAIDINVSTDTKLSRTMEKAYGSSDRRRLARRRTAPGGWPHWRFPARRGHLQTANNGRRLIGLQGRSRPLSPLRRARLPLGASDLDLSRAQETRKRHYCRLRNSRPQAAGLDVREQSRFFRLHARHREWFLLPA